MSAPVIVADRCSKWYGDILGVSEVSWTVGTGIVGLLGPNGAGKSTLMKMMAGLIQPSRGTLTIFGQAPYGSPEARARVGYCPEHESMYDELTALEFVQTMAELSGMGRHDAAQAAKRALAQMDLTYAEDRRIAGFSKGMRQRTKLAQTLVHDPDVLLLDEPLTGVDPLARTKIIDCVHAFAAAGKTVILSSHVLYEIEALTEDILLIYRGQVVAEGNTYKIRALIDKHPHRIRVECDRPRQLAAILAERSHVLRISFESDAIVVETSEPDACYDDIGAAVVQGAVEIRSLTSPDNTLAAVFEYLTSAQGGRS